MIPYGRQNINEADIKAVEDVLRSDFLTQGPAIECFEKAVADYTGSKYAVAVSNATIGLHIACLAAGLKSGDTLWTSPVTFVASANCGLYCGAKVDFVDAEPQTGVMSVKALKDKIDLTKKSGQSLPKVIIPVHLMGQPCAMDEIRGLANEIGAIVIEDAAHAIGASYKNGKTGSCEYSDITVFSFHPVKIITTGEGGMILSNREDLYKSLIMLRSHGITRKVEWMENPSSIQDEPWVYEQLLLGFNARMTDIQAALGCSQLSRIEEFIARRRYLADRYDKKLASLCSTEPNQGYLELPGRRPETDSAWHLYTIRLKPHLWKKRAEVFKALQAAGIGVNVHYIPVHTQPYYQKLGFKTGDFPKAEAYYAGAISLPLYFGLTDEEQNFIAETLTKLLIT
jgi:UDP-4-amino-4,6-dideoxy-N-acetyl-beta-L-altrosamine transaminase